MVSFKKALTRAWDSFSNDAEEVLQNGMSEGFLGDFHKAIEFFDRVNYLEMGFSETKKTAWFYKAVAYGELGEHDKAIDVYKEFLEMEEKDPDVWNNLGDEYLELENFSEALKCAEKAITIEKNEEYEDDPVSLTTKAEALLGLEKFEESLDFANQALKIDPDYIDALLTKAECFMEMENYESCLEFSKKVVELNSEEPEPLILLGAAYLLLDDNEKALESFEKGLKLDPANGSSWFNKACALSNLNRKDEALDALFIATSIDPETLQDMDEEEEFENIRHTERYKKLLTKSA